MRRNQLKSFACFSLVALCFTSSIAAFAGDQEKAEKRLRQISAMAIDTVSRGIVNQLRLKLGRGRWRYETSVDAYDIYLRARTQSWGGILGTIASISGYEQAIAKDPSFAPAYAGLGAAYATRSIQFPLDHPADELEKMRSAAEKAARARPLVDSTANENMAPECTLGGMARGRP